jgi:hypothetical protein
MLTITLDVSRQLRNPVPLAGCWDSALVATGMKMPKAAVDEDDALANSDFVLQVDFRTYKLPTKMAISSSPTSFGSWPM